MMTNLKIQNEDAVVPHRLSQKILTFDADENKLQEFLLNIFTEAMVPLKA